MWLLGKSEHKEITTEVIYINRSGLGRDYQIPERSNWELETSRVTHQERKQTPAQQ